MRACPGPAVLRLSRLHQRRRLVLDRARLGRAHHRALHFIGRNPGMTRERAAGHPRVSPSRAWRACWARWSARVTWRRRRAARTAGSGCLRSRRQGMALERRLFERQRERLSPPTARPAAPAVEGFRRVMRGHHGRAGARLHGLRRRRQRGAPSPPEGEGGDAGEDAHILVVDDDAAAARPARRATWPSRVSACTAAECGGGTRQAALPAARPDGAGRDDAGRKRAGTDRSLRRDEAERAGAAADRARRAGGSHRRLRGRRRRLSAQAVRPAGAAAAHPRPAAPRRRRRRAAAPAGPLQLGALAFDPARGELRGPDGRCA